MEVEAGGQNALAILPLPLCLSLVLFALYFLKVSVWEINDRSARRDDSLHKDDIELISEMLQNWLFDVYSQTWIIKILLKTPWMADTRILFVMINLTGPLQWEADVDHIRQNGFSFPVKIPLLFPLWTTDWSRFSVSVWVELSLSVQSLMLYYSTLILWPLLLFNRMGCSDILLG